jgi:hypothetical protein
MDSDDIGDDLGWYEPSLKEDLALRGPHGAASNMFWREDNAAVWDMLAHCLHPTKEFAHIKTFEKKADGHGAYVAFKERMLGPNITKSLEAVADNLIRTIKFTGNTNRGFTFDKMVTTLAQGFLDCGTEYSEHKKVDLLIKAINDPFLTEAKLQIRSSPLLKNSFHEAVSFIQELLAERVDHSNKGTRNVASATTRNSSRRGKNSSKKGGGGLDKWDPNNPGAHYTWKCWRSLTQAQRDKCKEAHKKKKTNSGGNSSGNSGGGGYKAQIAALNQKVATLTTNLEAAQAVAEHQSIGAAISNKRKRDS